MENSLYLQMLNSLKEGIYFVDINRKITFWNKGAEEITGFSSADIIDRFCFNNILNHIDCEGTKLCSNNCPLHATLIDFKERSNEIYLHHKDGHRVPVQVRTVPLFDEHNQLLGAAETFVDSSHVFGVDLTKDELSALAFTDALTEIPNRRFVESKIKSIFDSFKEHQIPFSVAIIDIDFFKNVNDTYGHSIGDAVLKMVSKTLSHATRSVDIAARWGGEEFIMVFPGLSEKNLLKVLEKVRMLVEFSEYRSIDHQISVTVSIGGSTCMEDDTIESLMERTDLKMYASKKNGRNCVTI